MINIKSLKRITEADDPKTRYNEAVAKAKKQYDDETMHPADKRYNVDIAKANADYQKADPTYGTFSLPRMFRKGEAAKDRELAIDAAEKRREAAKKGMVSQQDYDEDKFQAARKIAAARANKVLSNAVANKNISSDNAEAKRSLLQKLGHHIVDNPGSYAAGVTIAGLAGILALQKRKQRLPEPGQY